MYAVIGNPVMHSKSPKIHALFAAQTQQQLDYTAIQAPLDQFEATVSHFFARGGKGLNVTVPFKEQAWALAATRSERAERAGAVNTLIPESAGLRGDNTDGAGLVRDLTVNHGLTLQHKRILIVGAGGAVRGVLLPLLEQQPDEIVVANRTVSKAIELAGLFGDAGPVRGCGFDQADGPFDLIINGTSASLAGDLPPLPEAVVSPATVTYDMMYGAEMTVFNQWASGLGARLCVDGLGMLVEQAAESFRLWRGVLPQTAPVLAALREGN